jgi:hypothetical protein
MACAKGDRANGRRLTKLSGRPTRAAQRVHRPRSMGRLVQQKLANEIVVLVERIV